jgi:hypothetical protein
MKQRVCPYCAQEFLRSRFHPNQIVCSAPDCQRRRRTAYHRRKLAEDADYRAQCADSKAKWKENNPNYFHRYRAKAGSGGSSLDPLTPSLKDLLRLLRRAGNSSAKNNSALRVTCGFAEIWWVSCASVRPAKNTPASSKVVVIERDPGSDD